MIALLESSAYEALFVAVLLDTMGAALAGPGLLSDRGSGPEPVTQPRRDAEAVR